MAWLAHTYCSSIISLSRRRSLKWSIGCELRCERPISAEERLSQGSAEQLWRAAAAYERHFLSANTPSLNTLINKFQNRISIIIICFTGGRNMIRCNVSFSRQHRIYLIPGLHVHIQVTIQRSLSNFLADRLARIHPSPIRTKKSVSARLLRHIRAESTKEKKNSHPKIATVNQRVPLRSLPFSSLSLYHYKNWR